MTRRYHRIAVLMGGLSAEREVSLRSGAAVARALRDEGYEAIELDVGRDVALRLAEIAPDACFNALHGRFGEDGCMQGILETMGLPYTHSGVLASALAMHKERAKEVMARAGVSVAEARLVARCEAARDHVMPPPYVVKPVAEGSSVGVVIVDRTWNAPPARILDFGPPDDTVMVERFVPGRELTCGVIAGAPTDVIEIVPRPDLSFYDYQAKYAPGGSQHVLPAQISSDVYREVQRLARTAHEALGCRGVSRADFRYDDTPGGSGALICLEVNTQPGMTATSLVPELAAHRGQSFGELVRWIIEDASIGR